MFGRLADVDVAVDLVKIPARMKVSGPSWTVSQDRLCSRIGTARLSEASTHPVPNTLLCHRERCPESRVEMHGPHRCLGFGVQVWGPGVTSERVVAVTLTYRVGNEAWEGVLGQG